MTLKIEATLPDILTSFDWEEAFGEGECGVSTTQDVESLDGTPTDICRRSDIAEVIASVNGENDGDEWLGVFRLKDGRFLAVAAACDYTGWG